jgi:hypothetical protein
MPLWAGESVGGVKRIQSAAEIVMELARGADELARLRRPEEVPDFRTGS